MTAVSTLAGTLTGGRCGRSVRIILEGVAVLGLAWLSWRACWGPADDEGLPQALDTRGGPRAGHPGAGAGARAGARGWSRAMDAVRLLAVRTASYSELPQATASYIEPQRATASYS